MVNRRFVVGLSVLSMSFLFFTGCNMTQTQRGAAVGTGVGAGLGAAIGSAIGGKKGALIGSGIGALTGAAGGSMVGDQMDARREEAEKIELQRQLEVEKQSRSGDGKTFIEGHHEYVKKKKWIDTSTRERVWVEGYEDNNRKVEGHYETRDVPSGRWEEYEEKVWIPDHYE